jgi:transglutaminase-like putative cysteine protease
MKKIKILFILFAFVALMITLAGCDLLTNLTTTPETTTITTESYDINLSTVTFENSTYTYSGLEIEPTISTLEMNGFCIASAYYSICEYSDNIDAGTASVTIDGISPYYGSKVAEFTISPKSLNIVSVTMTDTYTYNGNPIIPVITSIKSDQVALTASDYDLSYEDNINVSEEAKLIVTGKNNYSGSVCFNYKIDALDLSDITVILDQTVYSYTGESIEPEIFKLTIDDTTINLLDTDYTITFSDNIDIGDSATITLTPADNTNLTGSISASFSITGDSLNYIYFNSVDGETFQTIAALANTLIFKPNDPIISGKENYIINWYTSDDYLLENRYFFDYMPYDTSTTLYGRWEEEYNLSFFAYDNATIDTSLDSIDELVEYIEYINFNNISVNDEQPYYTLNYSYTDLGVEISTAWGLINYPTSTLSHSTSMVGDGFKISLSEEGNVYEPTLKADASSYVQLTSINYVENTQTRAIDYNDFYIESLSESYEVTTSNQLYFLLEHGLKPNPVADSAAEEMYEDAKEILRSIINDDMTEYEKVLAIYEWLINNVTYDYEVLDLLATEDWGNYNAFYLEGVFTDKQAVCDGIAKAFVVLCQIEGISSVRITGDVEGSGGHAWNKVKIDGQWYVVDATWGNTGLSNSSQELMDYEHLLISDELKESYNCIAENYIYDSISACGNYNYYEKNYFVYEYTTYDYNIESKDELEILLDYCHDYADDLENYMINIQVSYDIVSFENDLLTAWASVAILDETPSYVQSNNNELVFSILFK